MTGTNLLIIFDFFGRILAYRKEHNIPEVHFYDLRDALASLVRSARILQAIHESECNDNLSDLQIERRDSRKLRARLNATKAAVALGMGTYVQTDPRGAPLYLLPMTWTDEYAQSNYPSGIAVPY
jgi:hypothetical protein